MANKKNDAVNPEFQGLVSPEPEGEPSAGAEGLDGNNSQAESTATKPEEKKEDVKKKTKEETNETSSLEKKDDRVDYVLPRYILSNDKYITVTHNGVNYQIETGKSVKVPKGVKEILDDAIERKMQAQGEEEKLIEKAVQL